MTRSRRDGRRRPDLLDRPPAPHRAAHHRPIEMLVDPVAQLDELVDLYRRGLLGLEEFVLHKERLLDTFRWPEPLRARSAAGRSRPPRPGSGHRASGR